MKKDEKIFISDVRVILFPQGVSVSYSLCVAHSATLQQVKRSVPEKLEIFVGCF